MILLLIYIEDRIKEMSTAEYHLVIWFHCHTAELYNRIKWLFSLKIIFSVYRWCFGSFIFPFVLIFCINIAFFLSKHLFKLNLNVYCFVVISLLKCSCSLIIILMLMVVLLISNQPLTQVAQVWQKVMWGCSCFMKLS